MASTSVRSFWVMKNRDPFFGIFQKQQMYIMILKDFLDNVGIVSLQKGGKKTPSITGSDASFLGPKLGKL